MIELVKSTDPSLRAVVEKFNFEEPQTDPIALAHVLVEEMMKYNGIGIAANQLGLPYRAFAMRGSPMIVCFNPIIVDTSDEESYMEEGCLTFPGLIVKVKRPDNVKVRYTEPNGNVVTTFFRGISARVFQHELDHLNGVCFTQRANKLHLERAKKKVKNEIRRHTVSVGSRLKD